MMTLKVLGSSSMGNCYLIGNDNEAMVIEAGLPVSNVVSEMRVSRIAGCLISHEHIDHAGFIGTFMDRGISCFCSKGTADHVKNSSKKRKPYILQTLQPTLIGNYRVTSFPTAHDYYNVRAYESTGFIVEHNEIGRLLFATDTAFLYSVTPTENLNWIMIECDYITEYLEENVNAGKISPARFYRTLETHMNLKACIGTLMHLDLSKCKGIILLHGSQENSNPVVVKDSVQSHFPNIPVYVAQKGLQVELK